MLAVRYATGPISVLRTTIARSNSRVLGSWGLRPYSTQEDSKEVTKVVPPSSKTPRGNLGLTDHKINRFEKYLMVWGGKYKSVNEVPELVSQDSLERARNKARIKINILMAVATLLGCFAMIWSGKKAQKEGQSVAKMNEDWHKKIREEANREKLEAAKNS